MENRTVTYSLLAFIVSVVLAAGPIDAKDIRLGGKEEKMPNNMVALPTIAVAIRTDDGGWRHIKIDAWLAAKDARTAKAIEGLKNSIIGKADRELPNHSFATLASPELGSVEAKKAIQSAVEASLGRPYTGDVLIRSMLVY